MDSKSNLSDEKKASSSGSLKNKPKPICKLVYSVTGDPVSSKGMIISVT